MLNPKLLLILGLLISGMMFGFNWLNNRDKAQPLNMTEQPQEIYLEPDTTLKAQPCPCDK